MNELQVSKVTGSDVQVDNKLQLQQTIERAENYMTLLDRMRKTAINLTNSDDWIDQGNKPYLQKSGCDKISGGFGVRFFDVVTEKEVIKDEKGEYIAYITSGYSSWNNKEIHETGTSTSRDDFFALRKDKETGEKILLPLSEIDPMDVRKKSHTNFMNRAIKGLLGLSFTWEEIEQQSGGRLGKNVCGTVNYNKGSKGGNTDNADIAKKRKDIGEMLLKLCDGEVGASKAKLEEMTKFNDKPGKTELAAISEKQVLFLHSKLSKEVEEFEKSLKEGYGA